jgi:chromosome segregation ATPase
MMPKQSFPEYLRHGKDAVADDPPERIIGLDADGKRLPPDQVDQAARKVYQRRLRDYATEFDALSARRTVLQVDIAATKKDIERLTAALAIAQDLKAFREDERTRLNTDLAGIKKERAEIEAHLAKVQRQLARGKQLLAEVLQRNDQLAAELAARQLRPAATPNGAKSPAAPAAPLTLGVVN